MQYREISLKELIYYFEGSASDEIRKQIDLELESNPDFAEEFEDWQSFLDEAENREAGIEKMKSFSQEWQEAELEAQNQADQPEAKIHSIDETAEKKKDLRFFPYQYAIAAGIALFLGFAYMFMKPSANSVSPVTAQIDSMLEEEIHTLLSPKASAADDKQACDMYLRRKIDKSDLQAVNHSLDSLLSIDGQNSKYQLIKALLLSKSGKDGAAIQELEKLLSQEQNTAEYQCKITLWLAFLYAKTQNLEKFKERSVALSTDSGQGYSCTQLDASIAKKLSSLKASM